MPKFSFDLSKIQTKDEIIEAIKSNDFQLPTEESKILIKILNESILKENQLSQELGILLKENEILKLNKNNSNNIDNSVDKNIKINNKNVKASSDPNYYLKILDEMRDCFNLEINEIEIELKKSYEKVIF